MEKSQFQLVLITTLLFTGLVIVATFLLKPQVPDAAVQNDGAAPAEQSELGGDDSGNKAKSNDSTESETETTSPDGGEPAEGADPTATGTGENAGQEPQAESVSAGDTSPAERPEYPHEYLSIGRFDAEAPSLVVHFDTQGATVRRIELNHRRSNGGFAYRDVDSHSAWIGELELESADAGCRVRLVVPGSPVQEAGIAKGDQIVSVNGTETASPAEYEEALSAISAGDPVELTVQSVAGESRTVSVASRRSPMSVIRPSSPESLTEFHELRRSFSFILKEKTDAAWPDLFAGMRSENWQFNRLSDTAIEFLFDLPATADGRTFQVVKRFSLPEDVNAWHVNLEIEVRNLGTAPASFFYELWGPTGLPTEGWWFQQKTHGNTWSFGKMAGARDLLISTDGRPYYFLSGADIVADAEEGSGGGGTTIIPRSASEEERSLRYLSTDTQYFTCALQPVEKPWICYSAFGTPLSRIDPVKRRANKLTDIGFVVYSEQQQVEPWNAESGEGAWTRSFQIFAGPKEADILADYDLSNARTFGWFGWISKPLIGLLHILHTLTFGFSYGLAIILLTLIVRSLMIPISRKAALNAQMMQHLSPQIKEIAEKYKDAPEKRMQAQQQLFQKYRFNPFGGCLVMLFQIPVFLGLYRGLNVDVALRDAPLIPGMQWCSNLAGPDQLFDWSGWMPGWFSDETGWLGPYFNLLPIVAIALILIQQKLFMPPATDDQSRMMQTMMKYMMIVMAFVFFKVPAGLCIYIITSSVWGIIERKMLPKPQLDVEKLEARASGKGATGLLSKGRGAVADGANSLQATEAIDKRRQRDRVRQKKLRDRRQP